MLRRFSYGGLVAAVVAAAVVAASVPPRAAAFQGESPITRPDSTLLRQFLGYAEEAGTEAALSPERKTLVVRARIASGMLPLLFRAGAIGTALAGGYYLGGAIDRAVNIQGFIGGTYPEATSGPVIFDGWFYCATSCAQGGFIGASYPSSFPDDTWYARADTADVGANQYVGSTNCGLSGDLYSNLAAYAGVGTVNNIIGYPNCGGGNAKWLTLSPTQLESLVDLTTDQPGSPPGGYPTVTGFTPTDIDAIDDDDPLLEAARDVLLEGDADSDFALGQAVDPDWEGEATETEMPDCDNLTYSACLDLLQDTGWVGTAVDTELGIDLADFDFDPGKIVRTDPVGGTTIGLTGQDVEFIRNPDPMPLELQAQMANESAGDWATRIGIGDPDQYTITYTPLSPEQADPNVGPDAPVRIKMPIPTNRTLRVPYPEEGPGPKRLPVPAPSDDPIPFEIFTNPPDMPEVPGPGDPGYPPVPPGGGGDCNCPDFDLTPITGLDWGDKFPFGFPAWGAAMLADTDDVCPAFTLQPPAQLTDEPLDISLCNADWESTYQAPVFLLLKFLMTFSAVWFIATRILGIGGGAVDDDD